MLDSFDEFVGNSHAVAKLKLLSADAAISCGKLPHMGFFGPSGYGKTTLARITANYVKRRFVYINSVAVKKSIIFRAIIKDPENTMHGAVVLLDECHRLPGPIQDNMLSLLEEPSLLVTSYEDEIIRDELQDHISFIFATTHAGYLRDAILSRLEMIELHAYSLIEKQLIAARHLKRTYRINSSLIEIGAIKDIGRRSRSGRDVIKNCDNILRYMKQNKEIKITTNMVNSVFDTLGIDKNGLTPRDKLLLKYLATVGQCGLETLEAFLNIPKRDVRDKIEPFLLRNRLLVRKSAGRIITQRGLQALAGEVLDV